MPQLDLEYNIDLKWSVPGLIKITEPIAVVAHSYASFVHESCAVAMFFVYKSHFTHSREPMLEIQSGLQDCQIDQLATLWL